jgi:hypothetical protein
MTEALYSMNRLTMRVVFDKALPNAQVNFTATADVGGFFAMPSSVAADDTVSFLGNSDEVMVLNQRDRSVGSSACLDSMPIGSEQLHQ